MKKALLVVLVLGFVLTSMSSASASGYPMFGYLPDPDFSVVVVGKYSSSDFTLGDANARAQAIGAALGMVGSYIPGVVFLSPSQLTQMGYGDADQLKSLIKSAYAGAGVDLYIFLDITKKPEFAAGLGSNVRIDVWVADYTSFVPGASGAYLYVASIELPEMYLDLLSGLL